MKPLGNSSVALDKIPSGVGGGVVTGTVMTGAVMTGGVGVKGVVDGCVAPGPEQATNASTPISTLIDTPTNTSARGRPEAFGENRIRSG